jgi:hypothetical protein
VNHRPVIDAGPALNFLSINKAALLISVLGPLSAPETVQDEVFRKSRQDDRFQAAEKAWRKLTPTWMEILSDAETPELATAVHRITQQPMSERLTHPRDLGEIMVITHAVVAAEAGETVTVLIDDGQGARLATSEIRRLQRLGASGQRTGTIRLVSSLTVLERAAGGKHIPDKAAMRATYKRLRELDDGLPPLKTTRLMTPDLWC